MSFSSLTKAHWRWLGVLALALVLVFIDQPYPDVAPLHHWPTITLLLASPWLLRKYPLSQRALGCIIIFLLLHTFAGRYTYSNVPYEQWFAALGFGDIRELTGWDRNQWDRLVHFAFGLLSVVPVVEICRAKGLSLRAALWVAFVFVLSVSCLYEILEWLLSEIVAGPLAGRYNGQQGDIWDAQKDMALATLGAMFICIWLGDRGRKIERSQDD